jgi:hypothetical protein
MGEVTPTNRESKELSVVERAKGSYGGGYTNKMNSACTLVFFGNPMRPVSGESRGDEKINARSPINFIDGPVSAIHQHILINTLSHVN